MARFYGDKKKWYRYLELKDKLKLTQEKLEALFEVPAGWVSDYILGKIKLGTDKYKRMHFYFSEYLEDPNRFGKDKSLPIKKEKKLAKFFPCLICKRLIFMAFPEGWKLGDPSTDWENGKSSIAFELHHRFDHSKKETEKMVRTPTETWPERHDTNSPMCAKKLAEMETKKKLSVAGAQQVIEQTQEYNL